MLISFGLIMYYAVLILTGYNVEGNTDSEALK